MPALVVDFQQNGESVKYFVLRPHRVLEHDGEEKRITLDIKIPSKQFNQIKFWLQSSGSDKKVVMDTIKIEAFNE